jgi:ASCH domain
VVDVRRRQSESASFSHTRERTRRNVCRSGYFGPLENGCIGKRIAQPRTPDGRGGSPNARRCAALRRGSCTSPADQIRAVLASGDVGRAHCGACARRARRGGGRCGGVVTPAGKGSTAARVRALSVRQPWAELIMRGIKRVEVRSARTHIRGRIHIYASLGRLHAADEVRLRDEYGLDIEALPRGVLVGTVEIVGCRPLTTSDSQAAAFPVPPGSTAFAWLLSQPQRASSLRKPTKHPQPTFFTPF